MSYLGFGLIVAPFAHILALIVIVQLVLIGKRQKQIELKLDSIISQSRTQYAQTEN